MSENLEKKDGCARAGRFIVFVLVWLGCITEFGLLGILLGWIPAMLAAAIWPIALVVIVFLWMFD